MLRDLVSVGVSPTHGPAFAAPEALGPRLLIVHFGDRRLAALEAALVELGYEATVAATAEDALGAIARGPVPDVLLTTPAAGAGPRRGVGFARDCLARWPALRALYIDFVPRPLPEPPGPRECPLIAPFNADQLAAALAELWPGTPR